MHTAYDPSRSQILLLNFRTDLNTSVLRSHYLLPLLNPLYQHKDLHIINERQSEQLYESSPGKASLRARRIMGLENDAFAGNIDDLSINRDGSMKRRKSRVSSGVIQLKYQSLAKGKKPFYESVRQVLSQYMSEKTVKMKGGSLYSKQENSVTEIVPNNEEQEKTYVFEVGPSGIDLTQDESLMLTNLDNQISQREGNMY